MFNRELRYNSNKRKAERELQENCEHEFVHAHHSGWAVGKIVIYCKWCGKKI